jgi:hypothetical protein
MGWLYPYHTTTKKMLVDDILATWKRSEGIVHATKCVKDGMWILVTPKGYDCKIIGLYLMEKRGTWGYKDMEEASGPFYFDCPLDWLSQAPVQNQNWRDAVIEHHEKKEVARVACKVAKARLEVNKSYLLPDGWKIHGYPIRQVLVTSVNPYRGATMGYEFRLPRKMMAVMTEPK